MEYQVKDNWLHLTIDSHNANQSVESFLATFHLSKKYIHLLFQNKEIQCNQVACKRNTLLIERDILSIKAFHENNDRLPLDTRPIDIAYEDEFLLVVNKPADILIHTDGSKTKTLSNRVQNYYIENAIDCSVRPIHRLDKDTTGLIIFCKCPFIQSFLDHELMEKHITRDYKAIVHGTMPLHSCIEIEKPIGKDRHLNKQRISKTGKYAHTTINVEAVMNAMTLVHCRLKTGRTHQIRVHLASIHYPILGDSLYGATSKRIQRLALHSFRVEMIHPISQTKLLIEIPLPDDMNNVLKYV